MLRNLFSSVQRALSADTLVATNPLPSCRFHLQPNSNAPVLVDRELLKAMIQVRLDGRITVGAVLVLCIKQQMS